jgi:branched-chain amino acid transport system substrate-binding protein
VVKKTLAAFLLIGLAAYWFVFRTQYHHESERERSDAGTTPWFQKGFSVGLVWPPHNDVSLIEGVQLAYQEIDASGPLAGKIRLKTESERELTGQASRDMVADPNLVAAIGHELEGSAIRASITYQLHGVLFLSPKSTDVRLTQHEFNLVFRLTPDDHVIAEAMAKFALSKGWRRIAVLHSRTDHGTLARAEFISVANRMGMSVTDVKSFFNEPTWYLQDYRPMIAGLRAERFDVIFLADQLPWAAKLLLDLAQMGIKQPVIATDKLDEGDLPKLGGASMNGVYTVSAVDPESTNPAFVAFRDRFKRRFGTLPGYGASQGYDAFALFAAAVIKSHSADPLVVATTLRTNKWSGLFGEYGFDEEGNVTGRGLTIKQLQNGTFHSVYQVPYPAGEASN